MVISNKELKEVVEIIESLGNKKVLDSCGNYIDIEDKLGHQTYGRLLKNGYAVSATYPHSQMIGSRVEDYDGVRVWFAKIKTEKVEITETVERHKFVE